MAGTLLAAVLAVSTVDAGAADAILERYAVRLGADDGGSVRAVLADPRFGNGTAQSRLIFEGADGGTGPALSLRVWRTVGDGEITFALLVFRVEIRGYDAAGTAVYSRQLGGFTFGDSTSGDWRRTLSDFPDTTVRFAVVFYGNYE